MQRNRIWCFTVNNYSKEDLQLLEQVECKYIVYGKEVGASGTPHLQGTVAWKNAKTFEATRSLLVKNCHIEATKDFEASIAYCKKDGEWQERGEPPKSQKEKGTGEKDRWALALQQAQEKGECDDAQISFQHARTIDYIHCRALMKKERVDTEEQHLWYYGESGTGKSRKARTDFPDAYLKMCNKWWDGYADQDTVLIEDFDNSHSVLCHHLKIWGDRYPFLAERKGAAVKIRPKKLIVTSNWHPSQIWFAPNDLDPILRRFKTVEFKKLINT
jgi:hypothetical protein